MKEEYYSEEIENTDEVEECEISVEDVITNNIERAQYYFPRLTKYLINKTSTMNLTNKRAFIQHQYLEYFLYHLCTLIELNDDYIKCIDYVAERLKEEPLYNKTYMEFTDGYLHNKDYNEQLVMQTIGDTGYVFESFFIELEEETDGLFNFDTFRFYAMKIFKKLMQSCDINGRIYSNEYYEYCFIASTLNTLQLGIEAEENQRQCTDYQYKNI